MKLTALTVLLLAWPGAALLAQDEAPPTLADCAALTDDGLRLACYDRLDRKSVV